MVTTPLSRQQLPPEHISRVEIPAFESSGSLSWPVVPLYSNNTKQNDGSIAWGLYERVYGIRTREGFIIALDQHRSLTTSMYVAFVRRAFYC